MENRIRIENCFCHSKRKFKFETILWYVPADYEDVKYLMIYSMEPKRVK